METAEQQLLLIDNNDAERKSVAAYLTGVGFIVLEASNVSQGLDILADHQPEVVLCDLNAAAFRFLLLARLQCSCNDQPSATLALTATALLQTTETAVLLQETELVFLPSATAPAGPASSLATLTASQAQLPNTT